MDSEQTGDNGWGSSAGGGQAVWTNAMSAFVLHFLANLVASGTRTSHGFKQVHLNSCARALNEHLKVQVTATQISNHLRKWRKIWTKVNKLKSLSGANWDENTCTIVLDHEHYTDHVKDHRSDADFLNTPIEHYHEMATIFGNGMASGIYAKSGSEPLGTNVNENENENDDGGSDAFAANVEEFSLPFTIPKRASSGDSSGSKAPKRAKVSGDDELISLMTRSLDSLAKAIEKSGSSDTDVPEDLWDNLMNLPGFEEAHLTHYYAHLVENPTVARAFNKLSMSNKMIWVARYIKNHLPG